GSTPSARPDSAWSTNENGLAAGAGMTTVPSQAVPARIGPEALAVALREALELGAHVGHAAPARIVQRPAAERGEAGGEDHGAVDRILVRHDAFAQTADADVEHRQDEGIGHLLRVR